MPAFTFSNIGKPENAPLPQAEIKPTSESDSIVTKQPIVPNAEKQSDIPSSVPTTTISKEAPEPETALNAPETVIIQQEPQENDPKEAAAWSELAGMSQ
jgi:hypothetical protein